MPIKNQVPLNITLDSDPQQLFFAGKSAVGHTLTLTNNDTRAAESVLVNAARADLLTKNDLSLSAEEKAGGGYKLIDEKWLECRLAAPGAWQPVDDWATPFSLGALAAGASVSFDIRVNVPTANADSGRVAFAIMISSKPATEPQVASVTIDQPVFAVDIAATSTATATVIAETGADDSVAWYSSDTSVATIGITSGIITGISVGVANITAISNANSRVKSSRLAVISVVVGPPVAGYSAWYDASDNASITEVAGAVSQWADKSGNNHHATQTTSGNKPLTNAESQNGLNVLSFATDDFLVAPGVLSAGGGSYAIFAVWKATGDAQHLLYAGGQGVADQALFVYYYNGNLRHSWFSNDFDVVQAATTAYTATYYDAAADKRGTNINDSDNVETPGGAKNLANGDAEIGRSKYGDAYLTGWIAELIIYDSCPDSAGIAAIEAYLKQKWGL